MDQLVSRIEKNGGTALAIAVDVTDAASVQSAADRVTSELGCFDLLFNNAGVTLPSPIEELAVDRWQRRIDLNIGGLMNLIGAFTPQLVKAAAERGVADLINTSSIAAQNIFPNIAIYAGTKAYVTNLSRHLRVGLGAENIRVSALEPGFVSTEFQSHITDVGVLEWLESSKETMDWLTPQDIAETVGFVAAREPPAGHDHAHLPAQLIRPAPLLSPWPGPPAARAGPVPSGHPHRVPERYEASR